MIVLIGMPGVGKSTVARRLGHQLKLPIIDSDTVIEQRIAGTIRAYFAVHGEEAFRDLEEQVIAELVEGPAAVLATGGGVVLRENNRKRLRASGTVVYLRASPEFLYKRLRHDRRRPLLQVADPLARLRDLYDARDALYRECAHFLVDVRRVSRSVLTDRILMQLELQAKPGEKRASPASVRDDGHRKN